MAVPSVLSYNEPSFLYDDTGVQVVRTLVTNHVNSYVEDSGTHQDLVLGASSNIIIEAIDDVRTYLQGTDSAVRFYTTSYTGNNRVDTEWLNMTNDGTTSTISSTGVIKLEANDAQNTIILNQVQFKSSDDGLEQHVLTELSNAQFYFDTTVNVNSNLLVTGDGLYGGSLVIHDHLVAHGNIYGSNLNVWRNTDSNDTSNNGISQIGYGFRVNNGHQLELLKYSKFDTKTVVKRIALFGQQKLNETMCNDDGITYDGFDILNQSNLPDMIGTRKNYVDLTNPFPVWGKGVDGIYYFDKVGINNSNPTATLDVVGDGKFTSSLSCATLTTTADISLGGHIIPNADITYDLGSESNRFRDLYLSGNTIKLGTAQISAAASNSVAIVNKAGVPLPLVVGDIKVGGPNGVLMSMSSNGQLSVKDQSGATVTGLGGVAGLTSLSNNIGVGTQFPSERLAVQGGDFSLSNSAGKVILRAATGSNLRVMSNVSVDSNISSMSLSTSNAYIATNLNVAGTSAFVGGVSMQTLSVAGTLLQNGCNVLTSAGGSVAGGLNVTGAVSVAGTLTQGGFPVLTTNGGSITTSNVDVTNMLTAAGARLSGIVYTSNIQTSNLTVTDSIFTAATVTSLDVTGTLTYKGSNVITTNGGSMIGTLNASTLTSSNFTVSGISRAATVSNSDTFTSNLTVTSQTTLGATTVTALSVSGIGRVATLSNSDTFTSNLTVLTSTTLGSTTATSISVTGTLMYKGSEVLTTATGSAPTSGRLTITRTPVS